MLTMSEADLLDLLIAAARIGRESALRSAARRLEAEASDGP